MKTEDLTKVKHIGTSRMKLLNDMGITTLTQLDAIPLEKLAKIDTIGQYYATLIKDAVAEIYNPQDEKETPNRVSTHGKKSEKISQKLHKQMKTLRKRLNRVNEDLKPLGKKKYLELYIDLKKKSKTLKSRLKELDLIQRDLSNEVKKNITQKAESLNATLKSAGKSPKKKKYLTLTKEIRSFSKVLKKTLS